MPDEKKSLHPETNFLPPLDMILTFFDKKARQRALKKQEAERQQKEENEKTVEKLIEKLSEKEK